jgi:DNA-binding SARP family transcriptional activator
MAHIHVRLLGPLSVMVDGQPLTQFYSDKVRALLAYLAVENGRPHRREALAGLLWPDYPESSARASLSQALFAMRKACSMGLPDGSPESSPRLTITRDTIQLDLAETGQVDAAMLERLVEGCRRRAHTDPQMCSDCAESWRQAASLYCGEFLKGFSLADCPDFEEWLLLRRERYRQLAVAALRGLAVGGEVVGDPGCLDGMGDR